MKLLGGLSGEGIPKAELSLLVVDDSDLIRKRLVDLLGESEFIKTIMVANNSEDALSIYRNKLPDIVILDIRIPGDNGIKTLEKMKDSDQRPIIIMFTNYPYEQYKKKCFDLGADYFFSKSDDFGKISDLCSQIAYEKR